MCQVAPAPSACVNGQVTMRFLHTGLLLLLNSALAAAPDPGFDNVLSAVRGSIDQDHAMKVMREVYASDRYFTFPHFVQTADYLKAQMLSAGLKNVEIVVAPADGVTQYGYWTSPLAWDIKSGRLEIMGPDVAPESRVLADYQRVPTSIGMWSGSTPRDGVVAEIVELRKTDLATIESRNLRGKLVLTDENPANIKWLLVKAGVLGAINAFTENPSLGDGRQWINAWGDDGWAYTKRSTPLLSFSITPRQAALVRSLLAKGPVKVRATVDSRYFNGSYPYVTGIIAGTGSEEVLTLGHTSEQGAEDNATGVAATLEALGTLNRLISNGALPRPKRSIRVLSMGEMYGSMHYVQHNPERIKRTVAAMCVDTPAASYDLAGTEYTFYMNPHVAKDFTDAFILKIADAYFSKVNRPWHVKEFTTGTDTYLAEPMVGIPTVWGYSGSGVETHHNSEDTPDRVDSRSLRDIATVDASFLYFIANAGASDALWLAGLSESRGYQEILKAADVQNTREQIDYALSRESQSVLSVLRLVPEDERAAFRGQLEPAITRLSEFARSQYARVKSPDRFSRANPEAVKMTVKRKRFGTLPLDDLPHDQWEGQPSGAWAAIPTLALYWCDGKRNLAEVETLTKLELGETNFDFVRYFRFLQRHKYVDIVEKVTP